MAEIKPPQTFHELPASIIKQMIILSTSGFGVVVALAWNEFIRQAVEQFIKPYLGQGSGVISLFIYAVVMTILAVLVTMQLTKIQQTLEKAEEKLGKRKAEA